MFQWDLCCQQHSLRSHFSGVWGICLPFTEAKQFVSTSSLSFWEWILVTFRSCLSVVTKFQGWTSMPYVWMCAPHLTWGYPMSLCHYVTLHVSSGVICLMSDLCTPVCSQHSSPIVSLCIDEEGEHIASCAQDGKVSGTTDFLLLLLPNPVLSAFFWCN